MNRIFPFLIFLILLFCTEQNFAQNSSEPDIIYRNELYTGGILHGHGFGLNFRRGFHKTGYKKRMIDIELLSMKHPKEVKNPSHPGQYKDYIYGKLNSLNILRTGYGRQTSLFTKEGINGVEIRLGYYGGLSLGMLKPVYLYIATGRSEDKKIEKYDPEKHFSDIILGRAPFTRGLGELSLKPGVYGRLSVNFEYAAFDDLIRSIETGVAFDLYPKEIPIMAKTDNKMLFLSVYVGLYFGKKWF